MNKSLIFIISRIMQYVMLITYEQENIRCRKYIQLLFNLWICNIRTQYTRLATMPFNAGLVCRLKLTAITRTAIAIPTTRKKVASTLYCGNSSSISENTSRIHGINLVVDTIKKLLYTRKLLDLNEPAFK